MIDVKKVKHNFLITSPSFELLHPHFLLLLYKLHREANFIHELGSPTFAAFSLPAHALLGLDR